MNQYVTPAQPSTPPLELNIFKDIKALTLAECRNNIFFLKYLLYKETNSYIQEKYRSYIGQLTNRLLELKESE
jgi:hypothetical protein